MKKMSDGKFARRLRSIARTATAVLLSVAMAGAPAFAKKGDNVNQNPDPAADCQLNGGVQHVIYIQFDNTHFRRDNPNVPSDLEQMPHLLNFIKDNGTLLTNDHTVLISHTAGGILSSLTGLYPDRHGQTVSNSYVRTPNPFTGTAAGNFAFPSSFGYWTDSVSSTGTPTAFNMVGPDGTNAPAPWVPYTRAGCDVGAIATANIVLENTKAAIFTSLAAAAAAGATNIKVASVTGFAVGQVVSIDSELATILSVGTAGAGGTGITLTAGLTNAHASGHRVSTADPTGDITKVFGAPANFLDSCPDATHAQWCEAAVAATLPNTAANAAAKAKPQADFVGFAIHCAQGSPNCANGHDDLLPQEVGGYTGFKGLFGAQEINPFLNGTPGNMNLTDLLGDPIADPFGQPGFPGFDGMFASVSLAYIVEMQKKGIPVTYAYISDAHDFHGVAGNQHVAFGPGDQGYVDQLKSYDDAFAAFFQKLADMGITKDNTLFVFTVDEGDHFVGVQKNNCDGVVTPCVYGANEVGEINANIDTLVGDQFPSLKTNFLVAGAPNAFTVHGDDAPTFYLAKKGAGMLGQTDPLTREFERSMALLTAVNPYTLATDNLMVKMADQTGMKALHMFTTGDPTRNPTFVYFADANYFLTDFPTNTCKTCINPLFAWNHGDIQPEIANTWLGFVGPGVSERGQDAVTWTDHTDVRPTILALLGLEDTYVHDGRVLFEVIDQDATPVRLRGHEHTVSQLVDVYKKINAPFGNLSLDSLTVSTSALSSNAAGDATYTTLQNKIAGWVTRRDTIAAAIKNMLNDAAFNDANLSEVQMRQLIQQANHLLAEVAGCAANTTLCAL